MGTARIFKAKVFERFASKARIADATLVEAVVKVEQGLVDADLGGGVIKQRVAREGQGESGGYRTLLAFRAEKRVVFLHGFAKSETDNIRKDELKALQKAAKLILAMEDENLQKLVARGKFVEVKRT